ncbi:MAG: hypothetical protein WD963_01970 [Candidatus Paceibacterota bacterium]
MSHYAENRKARFNYEILEKYEVLVLGVSVERSTSGFTYLI